MEDEDSAENGGATSVFCARSRVRVGTVIADSDSPSGKRWEEPEPDALGQLTQLLLPVSDSGTLTVSLPNKFSVGRDGFSCLQGTSKGGGEFRPKSVFMSG